MNHIVPFGAAVQHSPRYLRRCWIVCPQKRFRLSGQQYWYALEKYRRVGAMVGKTPELWISEPFAGGEHGLCAKLESANPGRRERPPRHAHG